MKLSIRDVQRLLMAAGYYNGGLDNDYGPKTAAAVRAVLENNRDKIPRGRISQTRMIIIAAQLILDSAGFEPGPIDGYTGHNTAEAFNAWAYEQANGRREEIREGPVNVEAYSGDTRWPTQSQVSSFYGGVGENQTRINLPYEMKLAWNTRQKVTRMTCHQKVAEPMQYIFEAALDHYGLDGIQELRLDYFGGSLNVRKMRGGSRYSMHSWGIAVDLDPVNNQLRWGRDRATFARAEYEPFWQIVESTGAISLGRLRNFDWMHWQFARI